MLTTVPLHALEVDLLVLPWFEGQAVEAFADLDRATAGEVVRALSSKEFSGRPYELFVTPITDRRWKARRVALLGAGALVDYSPFIARRIATAAGLAARTRHAERCAVVLRPGQADVSGDFDIPEFAQATVEGITLAEFDADTYKTEETRPLGKPAAFLVAVDAQHAPSEALPRLESIVERARVLGECTNLARGLVNEPGNRLTPREFAARAGALASDAGVSVEVLDEKQIESLGLGLLLGVARGSAEPPRVMVFRHDPPSATAHTPVLGLVGKGITFDTGGISIKPADGMERMKDDMAGGAAVACAMRALATLDAPVRVIGVVPATENMPGGRALKPGDILKSAEGKTVEVLNTDAEGRLILGDALWYARKLGATHLVDVATLTGAIVVALGKVTSGIFGAPAGWVEHVRRVADRAGDRVWPLPLFDDYREQLKSEIADLVNTGGRPGGSISAAMFLKEFAGGLPWAHLDVAGTAWADEAKPYLPKGPSGVAVRTLAELAFNVDGWRK
jgi:leucyl aminopeptidase